MDASIPKPSVGRIVIVQDMPAVVTYVHDNGNISVAVFNWFIEQTEYRNGLPHLSEQPNGWKWPERT